MKPLLIHPGLHKTATTWLQDVPFADADVFNSLMTHDEVDGFITGPHTWSWGPQPAQQHILKARQRNRSAAVDVISSEILTGNPFFGSRDVPELARRLKVVAPDAKILLTVRAQAQWLRSLYQQYVKRGGQQSADDFLNAKAEPQYPKFDFISLEYHLFADEFARHFDKANVLVLPQELIRADMNRFFDKLASFLAVPPIVPKPEWNRQVGWSPPAGSEWLLRFSTSLRDMPLGRKSRAPLSWLGQQLERVAYRLPARKGSQALSLPLDAIRPSNTRLQQYCPVDLGAFGYVT